MSQETLDEIERMRLEGAPRTPPRTMEGLRLRVEMVMDEITHISQLETRQPKKIFTALDDIESHVKVMREELEKRMEKQNAERNANAEQYEPSGD